MNIGAYRGCVTATGKTQGANGLKLMELIRKNSLFKYEFRIFLQNDKPKYNAINELIKPILHTSLKPKLNHLNRNLISTY